MLEAASLSQAELGEWLRRNGLHEAQLQEWRTTAVDALRKAKSGSKTTKPSAEAKRIKELERELQRSSVARHFGLSAMQLRRPQFEAVPR